jgi:hypothetical protein
MGKIFFELDTRLSFTYYSPKTRDSDDAPFERKTIFNEKSAI